MANKRIKKKKWINQIVVSVGEYLDAVDQYGMLSDDTRDKFTKILILMRVSNIRKFYKGYRHLPDIWIHRHHPDIWIRYKGYRVRVRDLNTLSILACMKDPWVFRAAIANPGNVNIY